MNRVVLGLCAAAMVLGLGSCKKKQMKAINSDLVEGSWKITRYTDSGTNETSDFEGSVFTFNDDGTVAVTGAHAMSGTWKVAKEDSGDDDLFDDRHLELTLSFPAPFDELSDDWEIESHSDSRLELKDDSGGGDDDEDEDNLTFEKI
jgi:hypothetical protein